MREPIYSGHQCLSPLPLVSGRILLCIADRQSLTTHYLLAGRGKHWRLLPKDGIVGADMVFSGLGGLFAMPVMFCSLVFALSPGPHRRFAGGAFRQVYRVSGFDREFQNEND
jgi:hypothetical protein